MAKVIGTFIGVVLGLSVALGISALMAWGLQFAWNHAVAAPFGVTTLTFWQTWGLMIIVGFVGSCFRAVTKSK